MHTRVCNDDQEIKEKMEKHNQEVNTIKDEVNKPKMEYKIKKLNQDIQSSKRFNIREIVGLVVSLLDKHKSYEKSSTPENKNKKNFRAL